MWQIDYAMQAAEQISRLGFRVFVKKNMSTYGFFSDGKGIGYFQANFDGIGISTVNAKGSACSGYSVKGEEPGYLLNELTPDILRQAFVAYPSWVRSFEAKFVKKYRDLEHFLSEYWDKDNLIEYESTN